MHGPASPDQVERVLEVVRCGDLSVVGRIADASNLALLVECGEAPGADAGEPTRAIYKPVRGERPLWDFPEGTLAGREVASWLVAQAGGFGVVPPTILRDGPYGPGSLQLWIGDPFGDPPTGGPVRVVPVGQVRPGWLAVVDGRLPDGTEVTVVHEDAADVRDAAVLDAVINNSDRKGSHLVRDDTGRLWGFDHGVTLHAEPKLRTVLWGWAGRPLRAVDRERLERLRELLADAESPLSQQLSALLPLSDQVALSARVHALAEGGIHPLPHGRWPAIPWPAL